LQLKNILVLLSPVASSSLFDRAILTPFFFQMRKLVISSNRPAVVLGKYHLILKIFLERNGVGVNRKLTNRIMYVLYLGGLFARLVAMISLGVYQPHHTPHRMIAEDDN
jgi:hypothetical protein